MANISRSRKSGVFLRGGVRQRETTWIGGVCITQGFTTPGGSVLLTQLNAAALALLPFTVVRTRGVLFVRSDQLAASENWGIFYAEAVVSSEASGVGVSAVPQPESNPSSDMFFVYEGVLGSIRVSTAVGFGEGHAGGIERVIDSKAMRKVEPGQDLISIGESCSTSGYAGVQLLAYTRTLVKLH